MSTPQQTTAVYNVTFHYQGKSKRTTRSFYSPEQIRRDILRDYPGARFIHIVKK